jgi:hypothetical protein
MEAMKYDPIYEEMVAKKREEERVEEEKFQRANAIAVERDKLAKKAFEDYVPVDPMYKIEEDRYGTFTIATRRIKCRNIEARECYGWGGGYGSHYRIYSPEEVQAMPIEPEVKYDTIKSDSVYYTYDSKGQVNSSYPVLKFNIYEDAVAYIKRLCKRPEDKVTHFDEQGNPID